MLRFDQAQDTDVLRGRSLKERHMARTTTRISLATLATLATSAAAQAHAGVGDASGLAHGFLHPVGGWDHVVAMVAVGMLAARLGRRALWVVPALFVALMAVGGAMGFGGYVMPQVEMVILLSGAVVAAMIAAGRRFPYALALTLTSFFALAHGMAHGAEMPADVSGLSYAAGFLLATALLHAAGMAVAYGLKLNPARPVME
jgi:urease accessory protein